MHENIFNYVVDKYDLYLGVDEIINIVTNNLNVDDYIMENYNV